MQQVADLVAIFDQRAREIRRTLSGHYEHKNVKPFLDEFNELHAEHLTYLRNGQFVVAREVVNRKHHLSFRLQRDEFWASRRDEPFAMLYSVDTDAWARGPLIQRYANDLGFAGAIGFESRSARVNAEDHYMAVLYRRRTDA